MNAAHLPANFASTSTAIEEIAFQAKDSLLVIDDFVPTGRMTDAALEALAERIFRAAGNRQGRSRMSGQRLRPPRPPRALLLATGEEVPRGHSLRSRILIIETRTGDVDKAALTRCQIGADQRRFASAMGGYLAWMAARYEQLQNQLAQRRRELREHPILRPGHARLPDMVWELISGWEIFLEFATDAGAVNRDKRCELQRRAFSAFEEIASGQERYHQASDPALRFLSLLRAALGSGIAHVANRCGGPPDSAEEWGWRHQDTRIVPQGERAGWVIGTDVFLEPAMSYQIAQALAGHERIPISAQTLLHRLQEQGFLESVDAGRRMLLVRRILDGCSREVLHLRASDVLGTEEPGRPAL